MGRDNIGSPPDPRTGNRTWDRAVMLDQGYDEGGAYWGGENNLRVRYTLDLQYIHFYRTDDQEST
jgi:hypothetical protein